MDCPTERGRDQGSSSMSANGTGRTSEIARRVPICSKGYLLFTLYFNLPHPLLHLIKSSHFYPEPKFSLKSVRFITISSVAASMGCPTCAVGMQLVVVSLLVTSQSHSGLKEWWLRGKWNDTMLRLWDTRCDDSPLPSLPG